MKPIETQIIDDVDTDGENFVEEELRVDEHKPRNKIELKYD